MERVNISDRITEAYYDGMGLALGEKVRKRVHWICSKVIGERVLDVGCSQGIVSILLGREGRSILGIDIDETSISYAKNELLKENKFVNDCVEFKHDNFMMIDFKDEKFDTIIASELLEHLTCSYRFIEKFSKIIKNDGRLIVSVPFGINNFFDHKKTYYIYDLIKEIESHFEVLEIKLFGKWIGVIAKLKDENSKPFKYDYSFINSLEKNLFNIENEYLNRIENDRINKENMNKQLENLKHNLNDLNIKNKEMFQSYNTLESKMSSVQNQLNEKERELANIETEKVQKDNEIEKLQRQIVENEEVIKNIKTEKAQKDDEIRELKTEKVQKDDEIKELKAEKAQKDDEIEKLKKQMAENLKKERYALTECSKLLKDNDNFKKDNNRLNDKISYIKQRYDALQNSKLGKFQLNYWSLRKKMRG